MPGTRLTTYIQNNFLVGERKTSTTLDRETSSSVQELVNYRVLKSGSLKRRLGTRQDFKIRDLDTSNTTLITDNKVIKKFFAFADGYIILVDDLIYYVPITEDSMGAKPVNIVPVPYKAVSYNLEDLVATPIQIDIGSHNTTLASKYEDNPDYSLVVRDIEILGVSIFVLFEDGLPYRIFAEDGKIYIAPYYYTTDIGESFDSFIRSFPIEDLKVVFPDVFFTVGGTAIKSEESTLTIGNENLTLGTCRAFLSFQGIHDVPSTKVDTSKMALQDYLFKPIIFNVLPADPEIIPLDVGRKIIRGTDSSGVPTVELAYLSDWDSDEAYSSTLLTNLNTQCRIREFSYSPVVNSSAELSVGDSEVIDGSKAQLIRELLYGRRYMIIPYETVGVTSGNIDYHTAFSVAESLSDDITLVESTFQSLALGLIRQNPLTFNTITLRNFSINNGVGVIKKNITGVTALSTAGFNLLRVPFPDNYANTVGGIIGTPFKELPWDSVVVGDWSAFVGAYIVHPNSTIRGSSIVLVSELDDDGGGVAEGVQELLLHQASVVDADLRSSSRTVAKYTYTSSNIGDSSRTRTYEYDSGGYTAESREDIITTEVTGMALEQGSSSARIDSRASSMAVYIANDHNSARRSNIVVSVASSRNSSYTLYEVESDGDLDEGESGDLLVYTNDEESVDLTDVFFGASEGYYALYRSNGKWGYKSFNDATSNGDLVLPGEDRDGTFTVNTFNELPAVDEDDEHIQTISTGYGAELIYMLFKTGSRSYTIYVFEENSFTSDLLRRDRELRFSSRAEITGFALRVDGLVGVFVMISSDNAVYPYGADSRGRFSIIEDPDDASISSNFKVEIALNDDAGQGFFINDVLYARDGSRVYEYEIVEQTREIRTPQVDEENSITDDFFSVPLSGARSLSMTLLKPTDDTGFQGFEVIPYNSSTITAYGYNNTANNEYLSDNRNPSGSFDYPALSIGGSVGLLIGSITALGQHQVETANGSFYTWFMHVRKGGDLSSFSTLYLRIGGALGVTYTLIKQNFSNLEGNVEVFIEAETELRAVGDNSVETPSPVTIEVFTEALNMSPYAFTDATFTNRVSSVYAECLIFELGMPSTARLTNGQRVIGGNDYNLSYSTSKVCYSSYNYDFDAFAVFNNNFALLRDDSVTYIYQNENRANNLIRTLNGNPSDEIKELFIKAEYIPSVFGNKFPSVISKYLLSPTSRAVDVITNSPQVVTFDNYINRVNFGSKAAYNKTVVNPRGRSVKLIDAVSSFDGADIFASSEEGLYNIPIDPLKEASLVHNQRFKFKPLVFHNRFVFVSPDDLLVTQFRSRERLGLKSNFSGADQINLLSKVEDIIFDQDTQSYMMPDSEGDVVVATDFDTKIGGFAKWTFGEGVDCLKLLSTPSGIKGIFNRVLERSNTSELHILSFDDSIAEDYKRRSFTGTAFESKFVSNTLLNQDSLSDTGLYRGYIKKFELSSSLCEQVTVTFEANDVGSLSYDYIRLNAKGEILEHQSPIDCVGRVLGYNPRVVVTQNGITDCNGIIYGFKYQGALNGV